MLRAEREVVPRQDTRMPGESGRDTDYYMQVSLDLSCSERHTTCLIRYRNKHYRNLLSHFTALKPLLHSIYHAHGF